MANQHKNRAHALLNASGSHRWLNCTPSALLNEKYGKNESSAYAQEGTLAHELAEIIIRQDILENIPEDEFDAAYERIINDKLYSAEMPEHVDTFVNYCRDCLIAAQQTGFSYCKSECRVDFSNYVPEGFGSVDCTIVSEQVLEIVDLKYGKGIPVYAEWNTQLMLYALGMLNEVSLLYDVKTVRCTICQPRLNNISSWDISIEDLLDWAESELRPKAELAIAGQGELEAGDWCRFCGVKNQCRKLYEKQMELAAIDFKEPELLTDEEVSDILTRGKQFVEWYNDIAGYAKEQAVNHNKIWPGFKLVRGKANRKWADDEDKVIARIAEVAPELPEDELFNMKLKGITDIEKLIGKQKFLLLGDAVVKPEGAPTLVPISDKRPALGAEEAINDFK